VRSRSGDCQKCGVFRQSLHRDHVVPKVRGGADDESNVQYLCANCHEDKTRDDLAGLVLGTRSSESHAKIAAILKGRTPPAHTLAAAIAANTGRPLTAEHRAKISASRRRNRGRS
jgi:hypothetical protein